MKWDQFLESLKLLCIRRGGPTYEPLKVFISYAWEEEKDKNGCLQRQLQKLHKDLTLAGCTVFLDILDMRGDFHWCMNQLETSHVVLVICTPRFMKRLAEAQARQPEDNLAYEFRLTLQKIQDFKNSGRRSSLATTLYPVIPLLFSGEFNTAIPSELQDKMSLDFRQFDDKIDYLHSMAHTSHPLGLLPTLFGIRKGDGEYEDLLSQHRVTQLTYLPEGISDFTGRSAQLKALEEGFQYRSPQVISGFGGIGKTQLALRYAVTCADKYIIRHWIPSENEATLLSAFQNLSRLLDIFSLGMTPEELRFNIYQALSEFSGVLLIFDNVIDYEHIKRFLPPSHFPFHVLLTTQSELWPRQLTSPLVLEVWSKEESTTYLEKYCQGTHPEAEELASELGFHALALSQALAYMCQQRLSIKAYLSLYRKKHLELFQEVEDDNPYRKNVRTTWSVAIELLSQEAPLALDILGYAAYLSSDGIPRSGLETWLLPQKDSLAIEKSLTALRHYSLISLSDTGEVWTCHRLVQLVMQQYRDESWQKDHYTHVVKQLLIQTEQFNRYHPDSWPAIGRYLPQYQAIMEHAQVAQQWPISAYWKLADTLSWYFQVTGQIQRAHSWGEKAVELSRLENKVSDIAQALTTFGVNLWRQARLPEAKRCHEEALSLRQALYAGNEHTDIARSLNNLGLVSKDEGNLERSECYHKQALAMRKKLVGEGPNADVAMSLHNLGLTLQAKGEFAEAQHCLEEALRIRRELAYCSPQHVAASSNALGMVLRSTGDLVGAQRHLQEALTLERQVYGNTPHPHLATSLHNLAEIFAEQSELDKAKDCYEEALEMREQVLGVEHSDTQKTRHALEEIEGRLKRHSHESEQRCCILI